MTSEELAAIKARAERWADTIELKDPMSRLVYEDVRALIAEVERLKAKEADTDVRLLAVSEKLDQANAAIDRIKAMMVNAANTMK